MSKIVIYKKTDISFLTRGICVLKDAITCTVEEQKNGMYEMYLEYPILGEKIDAIEEENIVKVSTPRGDQPFRIYKITKDDNKWIIKVFAQHIFYDLLNNFIEDINIVNKSGSAALAYILANTQFAHKFVSVSDTSKTANARIVRMNVAQAILGADDNGYLSRWGGEIERDEYIIRSHVRYGADRGVTIKYGKNLLGLTVTTDLTEVTTRIMPEGYNGLFLPEKYVDSGHIGNYVSPKIEKIVFSDVKAIEEGRSDPDAVPLSEAYNLLRKKVKEKYVIEKIDLPKTSVKVNFQELSQTEEYKEYSVLEKIYPFDTVTVRHMVLGLDIKVDMIKYKWDSIGDKYENIDLGTETSNFLSSYNKTQNSVEGKIEAAENTAMQQAIAVATKLINSGLGGYVVKTRDELLIMDTDNTKTAKNVWRWNINGLGYSSTGYNGPYTLAMTKKGSFNADFITTGTINADLIKTGTINADLIKTGTINADLIKTGALNADLIKGGTLKLGGDKNTYGAMHILGEDGTIQGKWDNNGLSAKSVVANEYVYVDGNLHSLFKIQDLIRIDMNGILLKPWTGCVFDMRGALWRALSISAHDDNRVEPGTVFGDGSVAVSENKNDWRPIGGPDRYYEGSYITPGKITVIDGPFMSGATSSISPGRVYTTGEIYAAGAKHRIVTTNDYGTRKLYCYEMPSPAFGDYGSGVVGTDGACYVYIEPIFLEVIEGEYEVFLSKYGSGDVWVDKMKASYFIVKGSVGLRFAWEIKAKQLDYSMDRLEVFEHENISKDVKYGAEGLNHLIDYRKEILQYEKSSGCDNF